MKTTLFCLIGQSRDWSTAFAVESSHASGVVNALNERDSGASWEVITRPITAEEISATFDGWKKTGII